MSALDVSVYIELMLIITPLAITAVSTSHSIDTFLQYVLLAAKPVRSKK